MIFRRNVQRPTGKVDMSNRKKPSTWWRTDIFEVVLVTACFLLFASTILAGAQQ